MIKIIGFSIAIMGWLGFMVYVFKKRGLGERRISVVGASEGGKQFANVESVAPSSSNNGVHIVKKDGVITISINPEFLSQRIQLKMDHNNDVSMKVLPGNTSEEENDLENAEAIPNPDPDDSEIVTPTSDVNDVLLSQIKDLASAGKVEFKDDENS